MIAIPFTTRVPYSDELAASGAPGISIPFGVLTRYASHDELDRSVDTDIPVRLVDAAEAGDRDARHWLAQLRADRAAGRSDEFVQAFRRMLHERIPDPAHPANADRLRGVSADRIVVDEVADMPSVVGGITRETMAEGLRLIPEMRQEQPLISGLVAVGAYELQSTEFDGARSWSPNDPNPIRNLPTDRVLGLPGGSDRDGRECGAGDDR